MGIHRSKSKLSGTTLPGLSGVTAGSYTNTDLTVSPDGTVSAAANGTGGSGGGDTLLGTWTASASSSLDMTTRNASGQSGALFQSDYKVYKVVWVSVIPTTNNSAFMFCVSSNGGSTWYTTNYYTAYHYTGNTGGTDNQINNTGGVNLWTTQTTGTLATASGYAYIYDPLSASLPLQMNYNAFFYLDGVAIINCTGMATRNVGSISYNALQFQYGDNFGVPNMGRTIASGTFRVYGVNQ